MITNEQLIYIIRAIHPEITADDHGRKYWVMSMVDGNTQLSSSEIYKWDFDNIAEPTDIQIKDKWTALGNSLPDIVPSSCTRKQAFLALLQKNKLDQVLALVGTAPRGVQIAFNESPTFEREDTNLRFLANAAGMSSTDLDQLFTLAATL